MANKIGRNDPCPCGSGIKYKKCCLIKRQEYINQQREIERTINEFTKKSGESKSAEKEIPQESD